MMIDQAALHGLLKKVNNLAMPLVSVIRVKPVKADVSDVKQCARFVRRFLEWLAGLKLFQAKIH